MLIFLLSPTFLNQMWPLDLVLLTYVNHCPFQIFNLDIAFVHHFPDPLKVVMSVLRLTLSLTLSMYRHLTLLPCLCQLHVDSLELIQELFIPLHLGP